MPTARSNAAGIKIWHWIFTNMTSTTSKCCTTAASLLYEAQDQLCLVTQFQLQKQIDANEDPAWKEHRAHKSHPWILHSFAIRLNTTVQQSQVLTKQQATQPVWIRDSLGQSLGSATEKLNNWKILLSTSRAQKAKPARWVQLFFMLFLICLFFEMGAGSLFCPERKHLRPVFNIP